MSDAELFPAKDVRMVSPRLKWCAGHAIMTTKRKNAPAEIAWEAHVKRSIVTGYGHTEEEACRDLGVKLDLKLWNEVDCA